MPAGGRRLVRGSVVRRPPGRGDGEASQGEASGGQESDEGGQEEDGDPHLPAPGGLPAGPGSGPCPQHHGHNVEGADTAQLPYSPQELDAFGLRCHAAPYTPRCDAHQGRT